MRLILHAGTHKTGTTSVQRAMWTNRSWLKARGFVYPELANCNSSHNIFVHRVAMSGSIDDHYAELMTSVDRQNTTILSAEEISARVAGADRPHWHGFDQPDYWDRKQQFLTQLHRILRDFDEITFFICFRRHDEFAAANYVTHLTSRRFDWSFPEYLDRCAPIFDYRNQLEAFRSVFSDVKFISFDDLRDDLSIKFCTWIGIPVPSGNNLRSKATPDARLVRWYFERMSADEDAQAIDHRKKFLTSKEARACLPPAFGVSLWQSSEMRSAFLSSCTEPTPGFFPPKPMPVPAGNSLAEAIERDLDDAFSQWGALSQSIVRKLFRSMSS